MSKKNGNSVTETIEAPVVSPFDSIVSALDNRLSTVMGAQPEPLEDESEGEVLAESGGDLELMIRLVQGRATNAVSLIKRIDDARSRILADRAKNAASEKVTGSKSKGFDHWDGFAVSPWRADDLKIVKAAIALYDACYKPSK